MPVWSAQELEKQVATLARREAELKRLEEGCAAKSTLLDAQDKELKRAEKEMAEAKKGAEKEAVEAKKAAEARDKVAADAAAAAKKGVEAREKVMADAAVAAGEAAMRIAAREGTVTEKERELVKRETACKVCVSERGGYI